MGLSQGRHDSASWRRAKRSGRQRGCYIYLAAEELERAGLDPTAAVPTYRVWPSKAKGNGRFVVTLRPEPSA